MRPENTNNLPHPLQRLNQPTASQRHSLANRSRSAIALLLVFTTLIFLTPAAAEEFNRLQEQCWSSYRHKRTNVPPVIEPNAVSFANIDDEYRVYSPFKVAFAVRGKGVAFAGKDVPGTGHHHILINKKLPINIQQSLPFDDQHRHFGKGQTSTTLDLPVGQHKLRLLFADYNHVPFLMVSKEITVNVVAPRGALLNQPLRIDAKDFAATCARWHENERTKPDPVGALAFLENIRDGDVLRTPFNVQLGAEGVAICAKQGGTAGSGYFDVSVIRDRQSVLRKPLENGETQFSIDLPAGAYTVEVALRDPSGKQMTATPQRYRVRVE